MRVYTECAKSIVSCDDNNVLLHKKIWSKFLCAAATELKDPAMYEHVHGKLWLFL